MSRTRLKIKHAPLMALLQVLPILKSTETPKRKVWTPFQQGQLDRTQHNTKFSSKLQYSDTASDHPRATPLDFCC